MGETVLFIDDEPGVRGLVEFWLSEAGFEVLLAEDGVEGMEVIRSARPDLIITDAMMPRMTGDELVETVKADPELQATPIVMATAAASPLRQQRMTELGCYAVLAKPLDEATFVATARAALASG